MTTDGTSTSATDRAGSRPVQAHAAAGEVDILRVLGPDGRILMTDGTPSLSDEEVAELYRAMVRARVFDEAATELWEDGKIAFHSGARGEEATIIGSAFALRDQDWLFPAHREVGGALLRGMSAQAYADQMLGNADDINKGRQMPDHWSHRAGHVTSVSSPLGTQITHAVGFSWAAKLRSDPIAVLVYFGEVATESGGFHDGMNFAGVFKTPTVFLCRNASGRPLEDKGIAYAVDMIRCDGNDLFAVIAATRQAVARAVAGGGATLVEALTSRPEGDDPGGALGRVRSYLARRTSWSDEDDARLRAELQSEAREAFERAAAKAAPSLRTMFDDVFAQTPSRLEAQREELEGGPRYPGRKTD